MYLAEARAVAALDHPGIVPVYDVGRTEDGLCFVVSKYVEGSDLAVRLRESRLPLADSTRIVAAVAEALHHAHLAGIVHRDVKPRNILLDAAHRAHLADFGLALKEEDYGKARGVVGTLDYMSPEQARGEGHRVDGRSDVFSLGVVLYELLTARRPFHARDQADLLEQIGSSEVRPPRQRDDTIPRELERICLKALAKRVSDRYTTALDFAEDLRHFLEATSRADPAAARALRAAAPAASAVESGQTISDTTTAATVADSDKPLRVVPKGLRAFDAEDADFFLELLPGPRDREGLPESVRFWKTRVEQLDPDETFPVGLVYGPSGCGKSSLIRAGLLPRLSDAVLKVYVESSDSRTEAALLRGLRKCCAGLPADLDLVASLTSLRRGHGLPPGRKVLIVLDQFEQWLHAFDEYGRTDLVRALRQCDGGHVQCLILVRGDFLMAATRFLRELEVRLVEGSNSSGIDLFTPRHARRVLAAFGRAFGNLADDDRALDRGQEAFLDQAVRGLMEEGRVVCVRLALFAEMMKSRAWTPATLREVGGTAGVGVTFLDETFSARTAPPEHRYHQRAARAVLKALLPEGDTGIRGNLRSHEELLEVSGYRRRPAEFHGVLRILDGETRLITPADPDDTRDERAEDRAGDPEPAERGRDRDPTSRFYQLTHDYLVPSLRTWLSRDQTPRTRAELRLAERSAMWNAKPDNRYLPSPWEHALIRLFTRRKAWTVPQRAMMHRSGWHHGVRFGALLLVFALCAGVAFDRYGYYRGRYLVQLLASDSLENAPHWANELRHYERWTEDELRAKVASDDADEQLRASIALLPGDPGQVDFLHDRLLEADPAEILVLRDVLHPYAPALKARLWTVLAAAEPADGLKRLRVAAALATLDPVSDQWRAVAPDVVDALLRAPPATLASWTVALQPVASALAPALTDACRDQTSPSAARNRAVDLLAVYGADMPRHLCDAIQYADDYQFDVLLPLVKRHGRQVVPLLEACLEEEAKPRWRDPAVNPPWPDPAPDIVRRLEGADGLLQDRFAFCQSLESDTFVSLTQMLAAAGYRLARCRPYPVGDAVRVAAIWTRDGGQWELAERLSAEEIRQKDATLVSAGWEPVDVASYFDPTSQEVRYAAVWARAEDADAPNRLLVGLSETELEKTVTPLQQTKGYWDRVCHAVIQPPAGETLVSGIWRKSDDESNVCDRRGLPSCTRHFGELQLDIRILDATGMESHDSHRPTPEYVSLYWQGDFAGAQKKLKDAAKDESGIEKDADRVELRKYLALCHAKGGQASQAEAEDALALFHDYPAPACEKAYLDAVVHAYLQSDAGFERLDAALTHHAGDPDFLLQAAKAYAVTSREAGEKNAARAERAMALAQQAVSAGFRDYALLQSDRDLDSIRTDPRFVALLKQGRLEQRRVALWQLDPRFESVETSGTTTAQLAACRDLIARDYRPVSISACAFDAGTPETAIVWHRPIPSEEEKERLATRQVNAAAVLMRLAAVSRVWPVLELKQDPRVRSRLIHAMSARQVEPQRIGDRLREESEVSIRRALLLCLGEFHDGQLPRDVRERQKAELLGLYHTDPDPGVHAAVRWLLCTWGYRPEVEEADRMLALAAPRTGGAPLEGRQWYVTSNGHTMVLVNPKDFLMGSPSSDLDRLPGAEHLHDKSIGRRYAMSAAETTRRQFRTFVGTEPQGVRNLIYHSRVRVRSDTDDAPMTAVTWYEAAQYCNWLSEIEGLSETEYCYAPTADETGKLVMRPKKGHLALGGYRLPTDAEWEYACRAGSTTVRYFGQTDELLPRYAWCDVNSRYRARPVASLKPNDFGLFDMLGNVYEWCFAHPSSEAYTREDLEDGRAVANDTVIVARGGAYDHTTFAARSAYRYNLNPHLPRVNIGFRVARTMP